MELNTQNIRKNLFTSDIDAKEIEAAIINFGNGRLGIIDGSLSQACSKALNELMPKNVSTIPVAAMESMTTSFGKYKPLHAYAQEQKSNSDEVLGMMYVYSESDKGSFQDTVKLNETARLMTQEQKDASVIYCSNTATDAAKADAKDWANENCFTYTEDIKAAVEHWSGCKANKKKKTV